MNGIYGINGTKSVCVDCESSYIRKEQHRNICDNCYMLHKEYSRPCTKCTNGLIFPNQEDDVILCNSCSVENQNSSKHMCVTSGCSNETGASWKTLCVSCFRKQQSNKDSESVTGKNTSVKTTSSSIIKAGIYKCKGDGCNNSVDASWKKICARCYAISKAKK
jgi:hypothetical protein